LQKPDDNLVEVGGVVLGPLVGGPKGFADYDGLVEALRDRAAAVGLSFSALEDLAGLGESAAAKYLSDLRVKNLGLKSFFAITETLGVRAIFVEDEQLLAQVRQHWAQRDERKAHRASHLAKRLGPTTIARVLPEIARVMGGRGGAKRRELPAETRRALATAAARARWRKS
jgi:transcriptional regulator with XRE-family HTH domain